MWIKKLRVKLFEPWIKMTLEVNTQFEVNQNYLEISLYLTSTPPGPVFWNQVHSGGFWDFSLDW